MAQEKKLSIRLQATGGNKLKREFGQLGKEGSQAFDRITRSTQPASVGLKAVDASARALNGVLKQAAGLVGAYAGIQGASRALGFIVSSNREFERLHASLKTVTGSAQAADQAFAMIEDFASETPFNVERITEAFIRLQSLGLEPSAMALRSYGNTASAMGKGLMQFVEAIADAATGEFERLKEFGIKARTQGEQVTFTFQGVSTTVAKESQAIESYLRRIGQVQFAGAMSEQMATLNGIISNIQDNLSRLAREVGAGGLNDALKDIAVDLRETTVRGNEAARALGESLGDVVRTSADALGFMARHADVAIKGLGALLIARTVAGALTLMNATIIGNAGAIIGLRMMAQVSLIAATRLAVVEGAARLASVAMVGLRSAMALVGGPAGIAVLAGFALWELARSQDAARQAASDHAAELDEIRAQAKRAAESIEGLTAATRDEALARWTETLITAENNVADVMEQLKTEWWTGSIWDRLGRVGSDLQEKLEWTRRWFQMGVTSVDEYRASIWKLAQDHPEFTATARAISDQIDALKAAELAASRAREQIDRIRNGTSTSSKETGRTEGPLAPVSPPSAPIDTKRSERIHEAIADLQAEETALRRLIAARSESETAVNQALLQTEQEQALRRLGLDQTQSLTWAEAALAHQIRELIASNAILEQQNQTALDRDKAHREAIDEITRAYLGLGSETDQARVKANQWRDEALAGLDATREGYASFAAQVEAIYQNMLAEARANDLESSRHWEDGLTRGFKAVLDEAEDMASQTERLVRNAFKGMEDALVSFVTTGKLDFKSLADSIIADLVRIQIRQSITQPLSNALSTIDFGALFGAAHTGGVIGIDSLQTRQVSPSVFAGAPKFHTGGVIGQEVPIIAKRGETVFTPGQMRALGDRQGNNPVNVEVNVINNASGVEATTQTTPLANGGMRLDVMIERIEGQMARNVSRGEGLATTLERRYGLNPAAGSYR
jgi:lambda family phage tail tape measure protein